MKHKLIIRVPPDDPVGCRLTRREWMKADRQLSEANIPYDAKLKIKQSFFSGHLIVKASWDS